MLLAHTTSPALLQAANHQIEAAQSRNTPDHEIHQALVDFFCGKAALIPLRQQPCRSRNMTRGLPDQLRLVEEMIDEATRALATVRWQEISLRPGSEPQRRNHQLRIELERHLAALRLTRIVLQVQRDKREIRRPEHDGRTKSEGP